MRLAARLEGATLTGTFNGAAVAGVFTGWVSMESPSTTFGFHGFTYNSGTFATGQRVQFAIGPAGSQVRVGPEFQFADLPSTTNEDQWRQAFATSPFPWFVVPAGETLWFRVDLNTNSTLAATLSAHLRPVSRP